MFVFDKKDWFIFCLLIIHLIYCASSLIGYNETECNIISHYIQDITYNQSGCLLVDGFLVCGNFCTLYKIHKNRTCTPPYFSAIISINYLENYTKNATVINNYEFMSHLLYELNTNYPINSTIPCFYETENPNKVTLQLNQHYVFCAAMLLVLWLGYKALYDIPDQNNNIGISRRRMPS